MCHPFSFIAFLAKGGKLVVLPHADEDPSSKENNGANSHSCIFDSHGFDSSDYPDDAFEQIFAQVELLDPSRSENGGSKEKACSPDKWEFRVDDPAPDWLTSTMERAVKKEAIALAKQILKSTYIPPGMTKLKPSGEFPVELEYINDSYYEDGQDYDAYVLRKSNGDEVVADDDLITAAKKKTLLRVLDVPIIDGIVEIWAEKGKEKKVIRPDTAFECPDNLELTLKF